MSGEDGCLTANSVGYGFDVGGVDCTMYTVYCTV